jgi:hypothetical protein
MVRLCGMFVVSEAEAAAIRGVFDREAGMIIASSKAPQRPKRDVFRASSARHTATRSRCHLPPLTSLFSRVSRSAHAIRAASAAWRADRSVASCTRSCSDVTDRRPKGSGAGVAGGAHDRSSGGIVIGCMAHAANSNSSQANISGATGELSAAVELRRLFPAVTVSTEARARARTNAGWKRYPPRSVRRPDDAPAVNALLVLMVLGVWFLMNLHSLFVPPP